MGLNSLHHNANVVTEESGMKLNKLLFFILHAKVIAMLNHICRENIADNIHSHKCGSW